MKKVIFGLLLLVSCGKKSEYEIYKEKYDSTVDVLDSQVRLGKFYLERGRETGDSTYFILADSCAIEAEKNLILADSFYLKSGENEIHSKLGDSVHVTDTFNIFNF